MLLFDLDDGSSFGAAVAEALDRPLAPLERRDFEDGEFKLRPLVDPCGADAYVIQSLHGDRRASPQDKLFALLMFVATLREHGAARVTAVVPYLAYARKDRRTKLHDPNSLRYVAQLIEAAGARQVMAVEVHNPAAFENAFRCPAQYLPSLPAMRADVLENCGQAPLAVASPDPGGVKRAQLWHEDLEAAAGRSIGFAFCDKRRSAGLLGGTDLVAGEVRGMSVLLVDDLIATGRTLHRAATALREAGASRVVAYAAHGLFTPEAAVVLQDDAIAEIVVTDAVPWPGQEAAAPWHALRKKVRVVSCAPQVAAAIRRSHEGWRR